MPERCSGFTLIELILVFVVLGFLASLAVSTYQTYVVRSQVSEGLRMAGAMKAPVTSAYGRDGFAPTDRVAAGLTPDPADSAGTYVSRIGISGGRIDITFGGSEAHAEIVGDMLFLTPYETGENSIIWRCGMAQPPNAGTLITGGAEHLDSTVDSRYLPLDCRP